MAIQTFTSGQILTAADTNTYLNNGGLVYVTAGTATAQNRLNIPACFTSTYTNYRVEIDNLTHTTANNLILRLSVGGTDTAGVAYTTQRSEVNAGAISAVSITASSAIFPTYVASGAASFATIAFDIYKPQVATPTTMSGQCARVDSAVSFFSVSFSGFQSDSTAFDGISLVGNTGNISCTMRVYGYRQA
jgi:hypothetical protein